MNHAPIQQPSRTMLKLLLVFAVVVLLGGLATLGYAYYRLQQAFTPDDPLFAVTDTTTDTAQDDIQEATSIFETIQTFLGFGKPKTYLLLFLNNNEYRPGGGFIGSYAVVKVNKGNIEILKLEGSEILDWSAIHAPLPDPPLPIGKHLGVGKWYFRDSNWSPDFAESARQSLTLYRAEGGTAAQDIDAVIAISTTVLEELLKLTGPITVDGLRFTGDNVQRTLEYEVEYGFVDRGRSREERKNILKDFGNALLGIVPEDAVFQPATYLKAIRTLIAEKHIMAWSPDATLQSQIHSQGADGRLIRTKGDSITWVDANLGALKTDHAMQRNLTYKIAPNGNGYVGELSMAYTHTGTFDWRTTRYLSYARAYIPAGANVTAASVTTAQGITPIDINTLVITQDLGRTSVATFVSIEPGNTKTITFRYELPKNIVEQIKSGTYTLAAQKQLGGFGTGLTLGLDFGTNIVSAQPAEAKHEWGDHVYRYDAQFRQDTAFLVELAI